MVKSILLLVLEIKHGGRNRVPLVADALRSHADYLTKSQLYPDETDVSDLGPSGTHQATKEVTLDWKLLSGYLKEEK